MTIYPPANIALHWERNGGAKAHVVVAVAVALAESGGNDHAISSSHDFGVWQINWIHFGEYGIAADNWMDIDVNARAAIAISGNGSNWAAWCTCWADPGPNCGHGYLPAPQPGSPAYGKLAIASAATGIANLAQDIGPQPKPGLKTVSDAWAHVQGFTTHDGVGRQHQLSNINTGVRRIAQ